MTKLADTGWEANANSLRKATLVLVYSTAKYCCPVWLNRRHVSEIDVQLNRSVSIISGKLKSKPWLPVFANISPAYIRQEDFL